MRALAYVLLAGWIFAGIAMCCCRDNIADVQRNMQTYHQHRFEVVR